jgi:hypothetical protein
MSQQAFALGDTLGTNNPTFFLRQTVSGQSASSNAAFIGQRIEGVRSYAGQTITILGWARRSSGSGNMAVELVQNFGTGGSPSTQVFLSGQTVTLTTSWAPFAVTFSLPSITGTTLGTGANDRVQLNFWTSAGSDSNSRTNSLGIQTIGVDLWGVHIKVGTHTTAATDLYKQPELGPELQRCYRYYRQTTPVAYGEGSIYGYNVTGGSIGQTHPHPVRMRASPTTTLLGGFVQTNCTKFVEAYAESVFHYISVTSSGAANSRSANIGYVTYDAEL